MDQFAPISFSPPARQIPSERATTDRFRQVSELALALSPSRERHLETTQQGRSFMDTLRAAWPSPMLDDIILDPSAEIAYPVAFGAALFAHGLKLSPSLAAYALQSGSNLVSAAVRLGTVGQTEAQKIIASLAKPARGAAALAARAKSRGSRGRDISLGYCLASARNPVYAVVSFVMNSSCRRTPTA